MSMAIEPAALLFAQDLLSDQSTWGASACSHSPMLGGEGGRGLEQLERHPLPLGALAGEEEDRALLGAGAAAGEAWGLAALGQGAEARRAAPRGPLPRATARCSKAVRVVARE